MNLPWLDQAERAGLLRPLDRHFALRLLELPRSMGSHRSMGSDSFVQDSFDLAGSNESDPIDRDPIDRGALALAAALVSRTTGEGHVCLDLGQVAGREPFARAGLALRAPALQDWRARLASSGVVGAPGEPTPLILDRRDRLYLARYWRFERDLAVALLARAAGWAEGVDRARLAADLRRLFPGPGGPGAAAGRALAADGAADRAADGAADAGAGQGPTDWQAVAAALAVLRRLTVISGGPGTGKTRTVAVILALLAAQAPGRAPRVALAAPTGKAAARLAESVRRAKADLPLSAPERAAVPEQASTLHRLLGALPGRPGFRHHAANPLHLDVLVVDEASMVDLPLMARTVTALPAGARLILLGDRDQLASVEAGAVLGDLCGPGPHPGYSEEVAAALRELTGAQVPQVPRAPAVSGGAPVAEARRSPAGALGPVGAAGEVEGLPPAAAGGTQPSIADSLVFLRRSYRFGPDSGIGTLAARVNAGDAHAVLTLLAAAREPAEGGGAPAPDRLPAGESTGSAQSPLAGRTGKPGGAGPPDLGYRLVAEGERGAALERQVLPHLRSVLEAPGPEAALAALARFRILCALREGPWGTEVFNALVERTLARAGLLPRAGTTYRGRPILVTRNDYSLGLFNGDVGVLWPDASAGGALRACFPLAGGGLRMLAPARLPPHETVYAMTVHKSQGSEFDEVLLVFPDRPSPVLTRELLYTAVTRARTRVRIWGPESLLAAAVESRVERNSGLREALWG